MVNESMCIGCGKCTKICPRNVLQLIPKRARVAITCSTQECCSFMRISISLRSISWYTVLCCASGVSDLSACHRP